MNGTPDEVAAWMLEQLERTGELYQEDAVDQIARKFGPDSIYENENGNPAIAKPILAAFRKLTGDSVVWVSSDRYWKMRQPGDEPGRRQS